MHWPNGIQAQAKWYRSSAQVIDILPTLLEVCQVQPLQTNAKHPLRGISLSPSFQAHPLVRKEPMFSEHENNAFMIEGDWKLVGKGVAEPQGPIKKKMGALQP